VPIRNILTLKRGRLEQRRVTPVFDDDLDVLVAGISAREAEILQCESEVQTTPRVERNLLAVRIEAVDVQLDTVYVAVPTPESLLERTLNSA
jgi:hypothetical protein